MSAHPQFSSFVCSVCSKVCDGLKALESHISAGHLLWFPYICQHCDEKCATDWDLIAHIVSKHNLQPGNINCEYGATDMRKSRLDLLVIASVLKSEADKIAKEALSTLATDPVSTFQMMMPLQPNQPPNASILQLAVNHFGMNFMHPILLPNAAARTSVEPDVDVETLNEDAIQKNDTTTVDIEGISDDDEDIVVDDNDEMVNIATDNVETVLPVPVISPENQDQSSPIVQSQSYSPVAVHKSVTPMAKKVEYYKCTECEQNVNLCQIRVHLWTHFERIYKYKCSQCNAQYERKYHAEKHIDARHEKGSFVIDNGEVEENKTKLKLMIYELFPNIDSVSFSQICP